MAIAMSLLRHGKIRQISGNDEVAMVSIPPHFPPARRSPESLEEWQVRASLPTMYDLPSEDPEEPGLPDEYHDLQPQLLSRALHLSGYSRSAWFSASDLNLYYDVNHQQWYKRPDWFLTVGVSRLYEGADLRRSYVVWQEGKSPDVVVEFLSAGTATEDLGRFFDERSARDSGEEAEWRGAIAEGAINGVEGREKPPRKFEVYERYLRVPHYIVYSRYTGRLRYFQWGEGGYQEQSIGVRNPLIWLDGLGVGMGIWQGSFEGVERNWLRWCDHEGHWLLTDTEAEQRAKEEERQAKEEERRGREQAETQLLQAARNLLGTGMEMAQVIEILNLSEQQMARLRSLG
jgi:Uma2 family endonuclease